jgi:hypothetical protein
MRLTFIMIIPGGLELLSMLGQFSLLAVNCRLHFGGQVII